MLKLKIKGDFEQKDHDQFIKILKNYANPNIKNFALYLNFQELRFF